MHLKLLFFKENFNQTKNLLFIILLFSLPFIKYTSILAPEKIGQELFAITLTFSWLIFYGIEIYKYKSITIRFLDLCTGLFFVYFISHYYLFSYFDFSCNLFWVFCSYFILFYLFQSTSQEGTTFSSLFKITINVVPIFCWIEAVIGILQEFNFINAKNEYFKVVGTFTNPNYLGVYMMIGIVFTAYKFETKEKNKATTLWLILSSISICYVLFLTQSRAAWMALFVALFFMFFTSEKSLSFIKSNRKKALILLLGFLCMGVLSLYLLTKIDTNSIDGRALIRKITFSKIDEKPLFGHGIGNFCGIYNQAKADYFLEKQRKWDEIKVGDFVSMTFNDYLQILFEIGIVGLLLLGFTFFSIFKNFKWNLPSRIGLTLIIAFFTLGFFTFVFYNHNAMIFVVWALAILVLYGKNKKEILYIKVRLIIKSFAVILILLSFTFVAFVCLKTSVLADFKSIVEEDNQKLYYKINNNQLRLIQKESNVEFRIGFENYQDGKIKDGLAMMEDAIKKYPDNEGIFLLSSLYFQQSNFLRAEQLLKLNAGIEPSRFKPKNDLLYFYIQRKQHSNKIKLAKEIINLPIKIESPEIELYKKRCDSIIKKPI